jgi:predicted acetyltransferase
VTRTSGTGIVWGVEIERDIPVEEARPWLTALATTLMGTPWDDDFPKRLQRWERTWDAKRTWGLRDRGRWVATLATEPRTLVVPGNVEPLPVDALTAVTVAATHRRRGVLRAMLTDSLRAARDRGDAVSMLIAAEWPIYGRFGYAPATRCANYAYFTRRAGAAIARSGAGSVRQVDTEELAEHIAHIYDRTRRQLPGGIDRDHGWWTRRLGLDGFDAVTSWMGTWILHEGPDGPDGYVCWKPDREFELDGRLGSVKVLEFAAATADAYRDLWAYLGSLDTIDEVLVGERPIDEPARWLMADGRALTQTACNDDLWLRLLDVPAALEARRYAAPGQVVVEVVDDDADGYGAGRWELDGAPDGATCTATTRSADVTLSQRVLASAYLGDRSLRAAAFAGGVDEHSPGAVGRLDAMLTTPRPPYNGTGF